MAWQIAIVFDRGENTEQLHANLSLLLGQMPVWAVVTYSRVPEASELRKEWDKSWYPEPALTLAAPSGKNQIEETICLIPTIEEHHPRMASVRLFGIAPSDALTESISELGYCPIAGKSWDGIGFAKPLSEIENVPTLELNASGWSSPNDFYDAFFQAVDAPNWHGRNFNALNDSIGSGGISKVEVPYRISVRNGQFANGAIRDLLRDFEELTERLRANGCPVELRIEE